MTVYTHSPQSVFIDFNVNPEDPPEEVYYIFNYSEGYTALKIEPNMFYIGVTGACSVTLELPAVYEDGVKYIQRVENYPDGREIKKDLTTLTYCKSIGE